LLTPVYPAFEPCIDHGHIWCNDATLTQAVEGMSQSPPSASVDALLSPPPPDALGIMWCIVGAAAAYHAIVYRIARRSGGAR
jgi:hypothetical protein